VKAVPEVYGGRVPGEPRGLLTEASTFGPCPRGRTAVRVWIAGAQAKATDADNQTVSSTSRSDAIAINQKELGYGG
jgi:hypothetical protein